MANTTYERGRCTPPFLEQSRFSSTGGFIEGRFCAQIPSAQGIINCCLPCPMTDWVYSDNFKVLPKVTSWLNVAGLLCAGLLLVTYFILPVEKTSRHYLTVGLVVAVCTLQVGFIIPLGTKPDQCHDSITPNSMYSDTSCAFSAVFLLLGGFGAIMWGFLRSLSLHLQICWNVVPGPKLYWGSLMAGIGVPVVFVATSTAITGVSYRFGSTCLLNHKNAVQDYWGPLLAFAAMSTIIQFTTFGYCIKVYIKSLLDDSVTSDNLSGLPSYNSSVRTVTAKQAYRRIKKVVALQWRGILIVLIIIANVVFLCIVFVTMDKTIQAARKDFRKAQSWLLCLVINDGDKYKCLDKVGNLVKNEATVMAVLILLSLNGFWSWILLGRVSMLTGWIDLLRRKFSRSHDFVSVDARRGGATPDPKNYEMIISPPQTAYSPGPNIMMSPREDRKSVTFSTTSNVDRTSKIDYFGPSAVYTSPALSLSTPLSPSAGQTKGREWDPAHIYAKGSQPGMI